MRASVHDGQEPSATTRPWALARRCTPGEPHPPRPPPPRLNNPEKEETEEQKSREEESKRGRGWAKDARRNRTETRKKVRGPKCDKGFSAVTPQRFLWGPTGLSNEGIRRWAAAHINNVA